MNSLIIPGTRNTPSIHFEPAQSRFDISGVCVPENAGEFCAPVFEWLYHHAPNLPAGSIFSFQFSYFNSTSLKAIFQMLKIIRDANVMGAELKVHWYAERDDEFIHESAEMFAEMLSMTLEVIEVPSEHQANKAS